MSIYVDSFQPGIVGTTSFDFQTIPAIPGAALKLIAELSVEVT
jgi:hypothetical protein